MTTVQSREEFLLSVKVLIVDKAACIEIGVFRGEFSELVLKILQPRAFIMIDPFRKSEAKYQDGLTTAYSERKDFHYVIEKFRIEIARGTVRVIDDFSYNSTKYLPDYNYEFIYIDASHLYQDVKRDLNDWLPKLCRVTPGLMCGHDYGNELFPGVKQAVDEFCSEHNFKMIIYNQNGGDFALRKCTA